MKNLLIALMALCVSAFALPQTGANNAAPDDCGCGSRDGVADNTRWTQGGESVTVNHQVSSPLHGEYETKWTDDVGSSGWETSTPHPTGGVSDSPEDTTSDGGDPPKDGGTYKIKDCKVYKKVDGKWKRMNGPFKVPDPADQSAFNNAVLSNGGTVAFLDEVLTDFATPRGDDEGSLPRCIVPGEDEGALPRAMVLCGDDWLFVAENEGTLPFTSTALPCVLFGPNLDGSGHIFWEPADK